MVMCGCSRTTRSRQAQAVNQNAAVPITMTVDGRPDPKWVRGKCPECGDDLVSNLYYIGGKGDLIVWECWGSLNEDPRCTYRRVL